MRENFHFLRKIGFAPNNASAKISGYTVYDGAKMCMSHWGNECHNGAKVIVTMGQIVIHWGKINIKLKTGKTQVCSDFYCKIQLR